MAFKTLLLISLSPLQRRMASECMKANVARNVVALNEVLYLPTQTIVSHLTPKIHSGVCHVPSNYPAIDSTLDSPLLNRQQSSHIT